jgi:hypothetical protein
MYCHLYFNLVWIQSNCKRFYTFIKLSNFFWKKKAIRGTGLTALGKDADKYKNALSKSLKMRRAATSLHADPK